ncbi:hypothetical protein GCM10022267_15110 [Lentzea roselyniae]|uniref:Uncharacterized protein n=1 Tax=Lentzea roselyniae TaxID=531940 RepID=A0ABP7ACT4_9PSEU
MQPDAVHELRPRVDQGDADVVALPQPVGRERSRVTAADHDNLVKCVHGEFPLSLNGVSPSPTTHRREV